MSMKIVVKGASLKCDQGSGSCTLTAMRMMPGVKIEGNDVAVSADILPLNVSGFIMCKSTANPQVAAIISSTQGATKEFACLPVPAGEWADPSALLTVGGTAVITEKSTLKCAWAGTIKVEKPGQELVTVAK